MSMFDINTATKKELQAELTRLEVSFPPKANVAALKALFPAAAADAAEPVAPAADATPSADATGSGLKIEKDRPEQNGIKRPSIGGKCRAVWDACDAFAQEHGDDPTAKDVKAIAEANGWNPNNASIEFYQWRKFNGIKGRQPKAAAESAKS
jgi:hypothetical protein